MSVYHNILIVSTSNINRGRMAESVLKKELDKKGVEDIEVSSRGLVVLFPEPMNPKASLVLENNGIEVPEKLSEPLTQEDVDQADLILTMKEDQIEKIEKEFVNLPDLKTIKDMAEEPGSILDPYGKDVIDYEYCFRELERLFEKIVEAIAGE